MKKMLIMIAVFVFTSTDSYAMRWSHECAHHFDNDRYLCRGNGDGNAEYKILEVMNVLAKAVDQGDIKLFYQGNDSVALERSMFGVVEVRFSEVAEPKDQTKRSGILNDRGRVKLDNNAVDIWGNERHLNPTPPITKGSPGRQFYETREEAVAQRALKTWVGQNIGPLRATLTELQSALISNPTSILPSYVKAINQIRQARFEKPVSISSRAGEWMAHYEGTGGIGSAATLLAELNFLRQSLGKAVLSNLPPSFVETRSAEPSPSKAGSAKPPSLLEAGDRVKRWIQSINFVQKAFTSSTVPMINLESLRQKKAPDAVALINKALKTLGNPLITLEDFQSVQQILATQSPPRLSGTGGGI